MLQPSLGRARIARIVLVRFLVLLRLKNVGEVRLVEDPNKLKEGHSRRDAERVKPRPPASWPFSEPKTDTRGTVVSKSDNN